MHIAVCCCWAARVDVMSTIGKLCADRRAAAFTRDAVRGDHKSFGFVLNLEECACLTHNSASTPAPATLPRTYERACELRDAAAAAHRHSDYQKAVVLYNEAVAYIADAKPLFGAPPSLAHTLLQSVRFGLVVAAEAVCTEVIVGGSSNSATELQEVMEK
jgi:hypothetical protein